jgi:hypothetical protein
MNLQRSMLFLLLAQFQERSCGKQRTDITAMMEAMLNAGSIFVNWHRENGKLVLRESSR